MSLVNRFPPIGKTLLWTTFPLSNTAISVVPPPMSTTTQPSSFSVGDKTASALANGPANIPETFTFDLLRQF